ncbi:hypothetical protein JW887_00950 [Candidatus Dojkabacteria bacterium]|nr:hypothetical protein [Candidatus Dojkabacteria bacterium]
MEERQMLSKIVKNLQLASPEEILKHTGIRNWESKSQSYTKSLYNNPLLPYDNDAIYCIDKLHLTFKSLTDTRRNNLKSIFLAKKQHDVNKFITLIPDNKRPSYYYYSFTVVVEETHFGRIKFFHTLDLEDCLVEVDNEVLYCQTSGWIIACIFTLAQKFNLLFNNFSVNEIARDSNTNLPKRYSEVYFRSIHCHDTIHEINGDHRYFKKVTKCSLGFITDPDDSSQGTLLVGKPTSNVSIKGYNKTKEIKDKGERKSFIQQIHNAHLDSTKDVYRLEITARSGAFSKNGILGKHDVDLLFLLDKSNLPILFFHLLGEKLEFKDLRTKRWENRNDHYDRIRIIDKTPVFQFKEISVKPSQRKYTHDRNLNHTKQMINRYLDRKIAFRSLLDYSLKAIRENADFAVEFRSALNKVYDNHRNKILKKDQKKLEKLCSVLRNKKNGKTLFQFRIFMSLLL